MANKKIQRNSYRKDLRALQIELVKMQRHIIKEDKKILIIFEGRDAAGKDGVIKRLTHLSPRETRVVALGKPSEKDKESWYFQRFVAHLPSEREIVVMNRSWYNRAGVEKIMEFCTDKEYEDFMATVLPFEHLLVKGGIHLFKYYLDISKDEQEQRLLDRKKDPLKQWKESPIDDVAQENWKNYSIARDNMLQRTKDQHAPWYIVKADDKKIARLNVIKHLMASMDFFKQAFYLGDYDKSIVFEFDEQTKTRLAKWRGLKHQYLFSATTTRRKRSWLRDRTTH